MKFLLIFILFLNQCFSIGTSFLKIPFNSKALSLSEAGVAFVRDPSLFRLNPALLYSNSKNTNAHISYNSWLLNTKGHSLIVVQPFKKHFTLGFGLKSLSINNLEFRNDIPSSKPLSHFSNNGTTLEFVVATKKNKFQLGSSIKYIAIESYIFSSTGFATDIGLTYNLALYNLSFGASLVNLGYMNDFKSSAPKLPTKGSLGFKFQPFLKKSKIKSIYLGSIDVFESNKIAYRFGNQFSINNFHLMSGIYIYKDNFSISGGFEIEKSKISISYAFNLSNHNLGIPHIFQVKIIIP